ncbi:hypothetical protein IT570_02965 [Candidatus Sumerlaeota bacterium]|nr:hypothetical protein [Candidatus Sumerlaeota bacterium]
MISQPHNTIAEWLRQKRALIALLRQDHYRRDLITLFITNLRALAGWKFLLTLVILAGAAAYLVFAFGGTTAGSFEILQVIFGIAAIGGGASLYSAEREAGTFELLWLATGSERVLLRLKIVGMMIALAALQVPTVFIASKLATAPLPIAQTTLFLITNTYLILGVMTLVSTFLPQSWAGGFVGAALLAAIYVSLHGTPSPFFPFHNPFIAPPGQTPGTGASLINRVFTIALGVFLVDIAARRLRRAL